MESEKTERERIEHPLSIYSSPTRETRRSAHDLRHYWATQASKRVNPFSLKEAGGWTSLATVDRYVEASKIANDGLV